MFLRFSTQTWLLFVVAGWLLPFAGCTENADSEDAVSVGVDLVNLEIEKVLENREECRDYAEYLKTDDIGFLCNPDSCPPLREWLPVVVIPGGEILALPRDLIRSVALTRFSLAKERTVGFHAIGLTFYVTTSPERMTYFGRAVVDEFLEGIEQEGIDTAKFEARLNSMSDLDKCRAEIQAKWSELCRPANDVDAALWQYYLLQLRAFAPGCGQTCWEFQCGDRTVLYSARPDLKDSGIVAFRVFDAGRMQYEIVISHRIGDSGEIASLGDGEAERIVQTLQQICCGILAYAFLGDERDGCPQFRDQFERAMGSAWVEENFPARSQGPLPAGQGSN